MLISFFIETSQDKRIPVRLYRTCRVRHLKEEITEKACITFEDKWLMFNGRKLEDNQTLETCRIQHGDNVVVCDRSPGRVALERCKSDESGLHHLISREIHLESHRMWIGVIAQFIKWPHAESFIHSAVLVLFVCTKCGNEYKRTYEFNKKSKERKWGNSNALCRRGSAKAGLILAEIESIFDGMPGSGSYNLVYYNCHHWARIFYLKVQILHSINLHDDWTVEIREMFEDPFSCSSEIVEQAEKLLVQDNELKIVRLLELTVKRDMQREDIYERQNRNLTARLKEDLQEVSRNPHALFTAGPAGDDLFVWNATIHGLANTPYEGGSFQLRLKFPTDYRMRPPEVRFLTRIYHPNISICGKVFHDILRKDKWTPIFTVLDVLHLLCAMLGNANPDDPFNVKAAQLYKNNRAEFDKRAREWTRLCAK